MENTKTATVTADGYTFRCADKETFEKVAEAIEKQEPKKTTEREYVPNGSLIYGHCPNCNYFTKNHFKYCGKCGQKLDWGDTE